jgi:hypothetical protein
MYPAPLQRQPSRAAPQLARRPGDANSSNPDMCASCGSDLIREAIEQYYKEDIEAAIDRAMVEGYTRVPDDGEFDGLAEASIRIVNEDDPW